MLMQAELTEEETVETKWRMNKAGVPPAGTQSLINNAENDCFQHNVILGHSDIKRKIILTLYLFHFYDFNCCLYTVGVNFSATVYERLDVASLLELGQALLLLSEQSLWTDDNIISVMDEVFGTLSETYHTTIMFIQM